MQLLFFLIGCVAGSVANAVIYRLPRNISWVNGKSICENCKHTLTGKDLIPVISYLTLGGKCRYCRKPIGLKAIFLEIGMGLGFMFLGNSFSVQAIVLCAVFWITIVIAVIDAETKLVSEALVIAWAILIVVSNIITTGQITNNISGLAVGVGVIGGIWLFTKGRGMGFGDVEIAAVMGLWLGWPRIVPALWIAFVSGAAVGMMFLVRGKAKMKTEIAFGPFLLIGTWIAFLSSPFLNLSQYFYWW